MVLKFCRGGTTEEIIPASLRKLGGGTPPRGFEEARGSGGQHVPQR